MAVDPGGAGRGPAATCFASAKRFQATQPLSLARFRVTCRPPMHRQLDTDSLETTEWLDALESVLAAEGPERAHYLLEQLVAKARREGAYLPYSPNTAYLNTIPPQLEERSPGRLRARAPAALDGALERGRDGPARREAQPRPRRPHRQLRLRRHAVRRGVQPLLARAHQGLRRRPGLLPGALGPRHLRPRLHRGPADGRLSSTTSVRRSTARGSRPIRTPG